MSLRYKLCARSPRVSEGLLEVVSLQKPDATSQPITRTRADYKQHARNGNPI